MTESTVSTVSTETFEHAINMVRVTDASHVQQDAPPLTARKQQTQTETREPSLLPDTIPIHPYMAVWLSVLVLLVVVLVPMARLGIRSARTEQERIELAERLSRARRVSAKAGIA